MRFPVTTCIFILAKFSSSRALQFSHFNGTSLSQTYIDWFVGNVEQEKLSRTYRRNHPKHELNFIPWETVNTFLGVSDFVRHPSSVPPRLLPRGSGPLLFWEKNPLFQRASQMCVEMSPKPFSQSYYNCLGILDAGISILSESKVLQDTVVCASTVMITGHGYICLFLILFRHFLPEHVPDFAEGEFHYLKQRELL